MNRDTIDVLLLILPTTFLLAAWTFMHLKRPSRMLMCIVWACSIFALLAFGATIHDYTNCTRLATAILFSSSILVSGPYLIWSVEKKFSIAWSWIISIALAWPSFVASAFLLFLSGQIWIFFP